MNWFQRFITNPNVHAVGAGLSPGLALSLPPPWNIVAASLGSAAGFIAAGTPEHPVFVPTPVAPAPVPVPTGSMHAGDYAAIAQALLDALKAGAKPPQ